MLRQLWWILGLVLIVGGVALAWSSRVGTADFGWFAYTPLRDESAWPGGLGGVSVLVVSRWQLAGGAIAALGLLVVASSVGFAVGRRRGKDHQKA